MVSALELLVPRMQDDCYKQQAAEALVHEADMESLGSVYVEVV